MPRCACAGQGTLSPPKSEGECCGLPVQGLQSHSKEGTAGHEGISWRDACSDESGFLRRRCPSPPSPRQREGACSHATAGTVHPPHALPVCRPQWREPPGAAESRPSPAPGRAGSPWLRVTGAGQWVRPIQGGLGRMRWFPGGKSAP